MYFLSALRVYPQERKYRKVELLDDTHPSIETFLKIDKQKYHSFSRIITVFPLIIYPLLQNKDESSIGAV